MTAGAIATTAFRRSCLFVDGDRALLVRPARQPRRRGAVRDRDRSDRWRCRLPRAAPAVDAAEHGRSTPAVTTVPSTIDSGPRVRCSCSTARRSTTSGRASLGGTAAELRAAARRRRLAWISPPSARRSRIRSGRRSATGMYPAQNGVRSAAAYYAPGDDRPIDLLPDHCFSHALVRLGLVRDVPNSSAAWQARPLWSILATPGSAPASSAGR